MVMISVASEDTFEIAAIAWLPLIDKDVFGGLEGPVPEIVTSAVLMEVGEDPAEFRAVALAVHRSPPRRPVLVTDLCDPGTVKDHAPLTEQLISTRIFSVFAATPLQLAVAAPVEPVKLSPDGESVGAGYAGREKSTTISRVGLTFTSAASRV